MLWVLFVTTNPKHKRVHFLLNVLMAHSVAVLICSLQEHVQKCPSFPGALVRVALWVRVGDILRPFMYHLRRDEAGYSANIQSLPARFNGAKISTSLTIKTLTIHWFSNGWLRYSHCTWRFAEPSVSCHAPDSHQSSCTKSQAKAKVSSVCG